jgi:hypothetical protein
MTKVTHQKVESLKTWQTGCEHASYPEAWKMLLSLNVVEIEKTERNAWMAGAKFCES